MNTVCLIGRLARDPELRTSTIGGTDYCWLTIAVPRQPRQGTDWINVTTFGTLAKTICANLKCGAQVGITGRLETSSFDDENGEKHFRMTVAANDVRFL